MTVLEGQVERLTYQNAASGYTVFRLRSGDETVTVVGRFPGLGVGEQLRLSGEFVTHPTYGRQFRAEAYESVLPSTLKGIEAYLGSGLIKGVGPALARRIVETLGARTLEVIEHTPRRLLRVSGIGPAKAASIHQAVTAQRELRQVMVFLEGHGITPHMAHKIYAKYGAGAVAAVRENPYRLAEEVSGIGFRIADRIAQSLGFDPASPQRAQAAADYLLQEAVAAGHCFLPRTLLLRQLAELLGPEADTPDGDAVLAGLQFRGRVVREPLLLEDGTLEEAVFPIAFHRMELKAARGLAQLLAEPPPPLPAELALPEDLSDRQGLRLSLEQRQAVLQALSERVFVLTGGPGTGKTTVLRTLLDLLDRAKQPYLLAAPTGRAAKRLAEATGRAARTLHRLLEYGYGGEGDEAGFGFGRGPDNPLPAATVVVDEVSMVDLPLFVRLVDALGRGSRLLLVGDADQLPSVGPGNVLRDLLASERLPSARLTAVFRQAEGSRIVENAHRILAGEPPVFDPPGPGAEFVLLEEREAEGVADRVVAVVEAVWAQAPGSCQVLSPMRRGPAGVEQLNLRLQAVLNPPGPGKAEVRVREGIFRVGDRVMQVRNNYAKEVFNGDVGQVIAADPEEEGVRVIFPEPEGDREVVYQGRDLEELTLAYAVSVHKSQGSEYPTVILALTTQHYVLLQRNLLYTAVTRAQRRVAVVGSRKALYLALRNNRVAQRYTRLAERVRQAVDGSGVPARAERAGPA